MNFNKYDYEKEIDKYVNRPLDVLIDDGHATDSIRQ